MMIAEVAYQSERGRRPQNEDMLAVPAMWGKRPLLGRSWLIEPASRAQYARKGFLFLVGDGVGGEDGGDTASAQMVQEVSRRFYADPSPDLTVSLQRVIEAANRQLRRLREAPHMPERMATTLTAVVIQQQRLVVANVGDSRAYLWRRGVAHLITGDHSVVQTQVDRGEISSTQAALSPQRNRITRSLGSREFVGVDTWRATLSPGDRLLLCSDGISGHLAPAELNRLLGLPNLATAVNRLIDTAYDNGSGDNMTAVLISVT
jgi:PPM family protein phosphatase